MTLINTEITPATETAWLEERRRSVGASDAPAVLGVCPYRTPIDVWQDKLGIAPPRVESEAMYWGKRLESVVLEEYERRTGRAVVSRQQFARDGSYPWMTATLDGLTADGRVVEVKTAAAWAKEWGEEDTDAIPEPYLVQVHHQLAVTGLDVADVAVLIGGQRFRVYEVRRNADLVDAVVTGEAAFWQHVVSRTPPDWGRMTAAALAVLHPDCEGVTDLTDDAQADVSEYERLGYETRRIEANRELLRDRVLAAMGPHRIGRLPDGRVVRRYLQSVAESTKTVTVKAYTRHYFRVTKGDSE